MNRLTASIYHKVHTTGWMADAVYSGAFSFRKNFRRFQHWQAKKQNITAEELYQSRHIGSISGMVVGVTNICNARCVFCAYPRAVDNKELKGGVMPLPLFKKIVDQWAAVGGTTLDLTHTVGDPLIDPGLVDKIKYAINEAGMKFVVFTTNGILLDRNDYYRRLVDSGVNSIYISTSGTDKESYEKVYGVKHYDEMISGVRHLLEYNRSKGEPVSIAIRFRNSLKPSEIIKTEDFVKVIKPYFSEKVRCNFTADYDNWGGLIKKEDMQGGMRLREQFARVDIPCRYLFSFLVRYDGSVRLCGCRFNKSDMDDMVVGNVNEQSLLEISKSSKAWDIIKGFYEGKRPSTCVGCTMYQPVNREWLEEKQQNLHDREQLQALADRQPGQKPAVASPNQPELTATK